MLSSRGSIGDADQRRGGSDHALRVTPWRCDAERHAGCIHARSHPVADPPLRIDAGADAVDVPGRLEAEHVREGDRKPGAALAQVGVDAVEAGGGDREPDLAGARLGV